MAGKDYLGTCWSDSSVAPFCRGPSCELLRASRLSWEVLGFDLASWAILAWWFPLSTYSPLRAIFTLDLKGQTSVVRKGGRERTRLSDMHHRLALSLSCSQHYPIKVCPCGTIKKVSSKGSSQQVSSDFRCNTLVKKETSTMS